MTRVWGRDLELGLKLQVVRWGSGLSFEMGSRVGLQDGIAVGFREGWVKIRFEMGSGFCDGGWSRGLVSRSIGIGVVVEFQDGGRKK